MSFYHIVIETNDRDKNKKFIKTIECDRTDLNEIKEEVVKPYILKEEVFVDGAYLKKEDIRSLKVKEMERNISDTLSIANDNIPA